MFSKSKQTASLFAAASTSSAIASGRVEDLIARIKSPDDAISGPAWQSAQAYGADAVKPLALLMADPDFETARKARRALYRITRPAGRPGADKELKEVESELVRLLQCEDTLIRREVLWLLSEIGTNRSVAPMAALLLNVGLREDARCALMRLPGKKAISALKRAFEAAPESFKYALADSLRQRGEKVDGYPSQKLVPTKQTTVVPLPPPKN